MILSSLEKLFSSQDVHSVRRKPTPVDVAFARRGGVCETLEGQVRYHAGDAILTGMRGERWPVTRASFDTTYEAVPPTRPGHDGSYRKHASAARAVRLRHPVDVPVGREADLLHGKVGAWLLQYSDGEFGLVDDGIFRESYDFETDADAPP